MKIAVINAFPDGLNPGMLSVDFSFEQVIGNAGIDASVDYFSGEAEYALNHLDGSRKVWRVIESVNDLASYDVIVYWGDFLHWIGYARNDWQKRQAVLSPAKTPEAALDRYYRVMLQPDEEIYEKIILFGGTIYPLSIPNLLDDKYVEALKKLLIKARLVKFRDMVSASYAALLTGKSYNYQGCDCAFLLDTNGIARSGQTRYPENGYIGYSFGRSGDGEALVEFVRKTGSALGIPVVDIGWLNGPEPLAHKISLVKGARFVITDIYHLSVTSLRERKPVFCIGRGCSYSTSTVSDKKKEFLFKQYLADDFYLFHEQVVHPGNFAPLLNKMDRLLKSPDVHDKLFGMLTASVAGARNDLLVTIQDVPVVNCFFKA